MKASNGNGMLGDAFATPAGDAELFGSCPDPDRIWATIECALPVAERREIVDHMTSCPNCAAVWRVAKGMGARPAWWRVALSRSLGWLRSLLEKARSLLERLVPSPAILKPVAAVASVVVVAVVVTVGYRSELPGSGVLRGASDEPPPDDEVIALSRDTPVLRWDEHEGAVAYELQVFRKGLIVFFEQRLDEAHYRLTVEELAELDPGAMIYWDVEVIFADGRRLDLEKIYVGQLEE